MRVAPIALVRVIEPEVAFQLACDAAALTHGHPTGWLAAGALAHIVAMVRLGTPLLAATEATTNRLRSEPTSDEVIVALQAAMRLARTRPAPSIDAVESLGAGWIAEESLAIAVYASLTADGDFEAAVRVAVNHSGDSDSTGSITGQILGTLLGAEAIPRRWLEPLELRFVIDEIARDIAIGYRSDHTWWVRYPGY